jgi:hypothetical protein
MPSKNDRVELEMKIMKYRALARDAPDELTAQCIRELIADLERKLHELTNKVASKSVPMLTIEQTGRTGFALILPLHTQKILAHQPRGRSPGFSLVAQFENSSA